MNQEFDNTWINQFNNALSLLSTGTGVLALLVLLGVFGFCITSKYMRLSVLAFLLWVATLGYSGNNSNLVPPMEQFRLYGRGLTTALLAILIIPSLMAPRGWRMRSVSAAAVAYFIFECIFSFREVLVGEGGGGELTRFLLAAVLYVVTFFVLGYGLPRWMQSLDDFHRVIAALGLTGAIFCGGVFLQTMASVASTQDAGGRLCGTTGNPQHCAVILALLITPLCYLVSYKHQALYRRVFFGAVAALASIFLLWTGSRTGALMSVTGLVIMFRYRMGRMMLLGSFAAIFVLLFLNIYSGNDIVSSHLTSTEDTRSNAWEMQWNQFCASPITGSSSGGGAFVLSENSYLATAARYGIVGLIPLLVVMFLAARSMLRLHRSRKYLGDFTLAADMVIANMVSLAVGAWFEAYLLGTLTLMVYFIYIDFALMNALIDLADAPIPDAQTRGYEVVFSGMPQPQLA